MTDHKFFNDFFNDDKPTSRQCTDCGTEENLSVLYTTESGDQVWICPRCKSERQAAAERQADSARQRREVGERYDRWEESR